jgi:glutamyl-tRNA reductase
LAERTREAADAEAMIAAEVERYHQKLRAVNVAPAIVGLQQKAEELRLAELKRVQSRLGGLTAEQFAAVEALSRGLVNKFLHPPMQALKQAAREGDVARIEAIRETYSLGAETGIARIVADASGGGEASASVAAEEPVVEKVGS